MGSVFQCRRRRIWHVSYLGYAIHQFRVLDWVNNISFPHLNLFFSNTFLRLDQYFLYIQFKRYVPSTKRHLLEKIQDENISEDKRKQYEEEYHSICDLEVEEFKNKVYSTSSVKKRNWFFKLWPRNDLAYWS